MLKRPRANPLTLVLGAVAVVAVGLAVTALGTSTGAARATERTVTATRGVVQSTVSGSGSLEPSATRDLSFGTASGTVTAVEVRAGEHVTKGQLLAKVDPSDAEVTLAQAEADLQSAEDADDDTASAQAKVDAAELAVQDAEDAVAGTKLYAPVSGTIADVAISVGDTASSTAMTLVQISHYKMTVALGESDIGKVKVGQVATVTVSAAGDEQFAAEVTHVDLLASSSSDTTTSSSSSAVSYSVTLKLTQTSKNLKSGMSATADIVTGQVSGITVPTQALSGNTVTVVKNGARTVRQVQTGLAGDTVTQITSGLKAGETVVVTSASAAAGASATSSSSTTSQQQQQSGGGVSGALSGASAGGPPSGGGAPGAGGTP